MIKYIIVKSQLTFFKSVSDILLIIAKGCEILATGDIKVIKNFYSIRVILDIKASTTQYPNVKIVSVMIFDVLFILDLM